MNINQACIDACQKCATDCETCLDAMLNQQMPDDCARSCRECVDICVYCAQSLARNSRFAGELCALCEKICQWCAESCEVHDHYHCQVCAESCRRCALGCQQLVLVT